MTKPDIIVSQVVEAPLEELWESWADFGSIYKFHEDVVRTTILTKSTPRGVGAVRLCQLQDGRNEIEERITEWKPMEKISMEFKRTSLPIASATAEFVFEACAGARSRVVMRFCFKPRGLMMRLMKPVMKSKMQAGFETLLLDNKRFVERF